MKANLTQAVHEDVCQIAAELPASAELWLGGSGAAEAAAAAPLISAAPQQAGVPTNLHPGVDGGHGYRHRGQGYGYEEFHGVRPRNYLMDQAPPTFARREALPLNSGNVFATTAAPTLQITSRPQRPAFRPERLFVSIPVGGASTDTAAAWIIQDVSIGNKSQFAQSGALPGDMFANLSIDSFVSFDTVQTAMDVTITVTYVGGAGSEATIYFYGGMLGTSAVHG